jgi:hypothetical protein
METKCCSRCNEIKEFAKFIKKRNICKDCSNKWSKIARDKRYIEEINSTEEKICKVCNTSKTVTDFIKNRYLCKCCYNKKYRDKYENDLNYCSKIILKSKNKNRKVSNESQNKRYHFNPVNKFMRIQRSRIRIALNTKQKHTIEYLGCNAEQYFNWIQYNFNDNFNFENHGKVWHIDHVIPLYNFNIENQEEQLLAFNWRNTTPLFIIDNLKKGTKINSLQIEQHLKKLLDYHKEKNIEMPQTYIDLFAKHLADGNTLKLSLPLTLGNICEELS